MVCYGSRWFKMALECVISKSKTEQKEKMDILTVLAIVVVVLVLIPVIVTSFLRNVNAGTVRMVSWLGGSTRIYRGPGKSYEIPLLTTGTTLSSKAINVDLDITDQTADLDSSGVPRPIKVRVLASAIVSVGDTDTLITTAANRFFSKGESDQVAILTDLLASAARRAINLLTHDQLFSAKSTPSSSAAPIKALELSRNPILAAEEDDDPLAIIIRKACSKELTDLGLIFNSLNIKVVQSEVAEARRRQSAAEAQANADIVTTQQQRRSREAQIEAARTISDRERELAQTQASNAALVAEAEAKRQDALALQRGSELKATQLAQADADAERVLIQARAQAEAEAIGIRLRAEANAESVRKVSQAILEGGEGYLRYRQVEMLPLLAPMIAEALSKARMVTISSGGSSGGNTGGAATETTSNIAQVIQTILATQLISTTGLLEGAKGSSHIDNSDFLIDGDKK
jgi:flotillin